MPDFANTRFIQFPHPGTEHWPDEGSLKRWHARERDHRRKFLALPGCWSDGDISHSGDMWAWAEWEPESEVIRELSQPDPTYPRYLWRPYYARKPAVAYRDLHNTDPFIYDGFYYTNCKQASTPALEGLRHLGQGSVIVFGSKFRGSWVLDLVLVVGEYIDHHVSNYQALLVGRVPPPYFHITLAPTYANARDFNNGDWRFRLYRGATVDAPLNGMFSFFPCVAAGTEVGFPRPAITLPKEYFTPGLALGAKGHRMRARAVPADEIQDLWESVRDQVLYQGLMLGTYAAMPECRA